MVGSLLVEGTNSHTIHSDTKGESDNWPGVQPSLLHADLTPRADGLGVIRKDQGVFEGGREVLLVRNRFHSEDNAESTTPENKAQLALFGPQLVPLTPQMAVAQLMWFCQPQVAPRPVVPVSTSPSMFCIRFTFRFQSKEDRSKYMYYIVYMHQWRAAKVSETHNSQSRVILSAPNQDQLVFNRVLWCVALQDVNEALLVAQAVIENPI
jgi:hypothetical protein